MTKDFYLSGTDGQKSSYFKYLKTISQIAGENISSSELDDFYDLEKVLVGKQLNPEESNNVDKIYNIYTFDEIQSLFPSIDLEKVLAGSGLKKENKILVMNEEMTKEFAGLFTDENLEALKNVAKFSLLMNYGGSLNTAFTDASNTFNKEYLGISGSYSDEEHATMNVASIMPDYKKLYRSMANSWASTKTREFAKYAAEFGTVVRHK